MTKHRHDYIIEREGFLYCECGKKVLNLSRVSDEEGMMVGTKKNNILYRVRSSRLRYFFPGEWIGFIKLVKKKQHRFFFIVCIFTGGRIMEVLNLQHRDIDKERGTITYRTTKERKAKKNYAAMGNSRTFFVASNFFTEYKILIRGEKVNPNDFIFLDNSKLPDNYLELDNKEKRKYYNSKKVLYHLALKRYLKKSGVDDYYNFSMHNLRKTYGLWMRLFIKDNSDMCYRMGHDMDTFMDHYKTSNIISDKEKVQILNIYGDVQ